MTKEEAILKGFCCKTDNCTGPGQWFYTNSGGYTIDYFTKEVVPGRRVHPNFIYDEEKLLRLGDKKIFDESGHYVAWYSSVEDYCFPVLTFEEYEYPVSGEEEISLTIKEARNLGYKLIERDDCDYKPGYIYYCYDSFDDENDLVTKITVYDYDKDGNRKEVYKEINGLQN